MQGLVQAAAGFEHRGQDVTGPELGDRQVEVPTRARSGWGCRRVCTTPGDASWLQPGPFLGPRLEQRNQAQKVRCEKRSACRT